MIKHILFLFMLLFSHLSVSAGITDGKFSINQIFDVQYNWSGTTLNASNFIAPYNKDFQPVTTAAGQYFQFFASSTNPGTYGLKLMNNNGTQHSIVHDTGDITALGNGAIFYIGSGFFGNVITTAQGYNYGASAQFTNMDTNVTSSDLNNYTYASSTPLSAGQTAQSATPPPPTYPSYVTIGSGTAGTMEFGTNADITPAQQTRVTTWSNKTISSGNSIYIDQIGGSGNTVTMEQDGNKNKIDATLDGSINTITVKQGTLGIGQNEIKLGVIGSYNALDISQARNDQGIVTGTNGQYHDVTVNGLNNTLTARQSNTGGVGGHYMETTINGNQNNVTNKQTDNGNKIMFTTITGNNNTVEAIQKGTGQHYLENKLIGNGNSVSALQEGTVANKATLDLTNNGGPASVILQQTGGQNVTVTTTCATAGGCAPITVRQGY